MKREISEYGFPPQFPEITQEKEEISQPDPADPTKRVKKVSCVVQIWFYKLVVQVKSKVATKGGDAVYQWGIMKSFGLSDNDILK